MKFFNLLGVALAKECYDAVLPKGPSAKRGEMSIGELKVATEEFFTCAGRDSNLDMTPFHDAIAQPKGLGQTPTFSQVPHLCRTVGVSSFYRL